MPSRKQPSSKLSLNEPDAAYFSGKARSEIRWEGVSGENVNASCYHGTRGTPQAIYFATETPEGVQVSSVTGQIIAAVEALDFSSSTLSEALQTALRNESAGSHFRVVCADNPSVELARDGNPPERHTASSNISKDFNPCDACW